MEAGNEYAETKNRMRRLISHSVVVPVLKTVYKSPDECKPLFISAICFWHGVILISLYSIVFFFSIRTPFYLP